AQLKVVTSQRRSSSESPASLLGGRRTCTADTITVDDLSGTALTEARNALAANGGVGDGAADNVIVNGSGGDDVIVVAGDASGASVLGLAARVTIAGAEAAGDRLTISTLRGDDVVEASGLTAGAIRLTGDG